jgi:hypothetical protein
MLIEMSLMIKRLIPINGNIVMVGEEQYLPTKNNSIIPREKIIF